MVGREGEGLVEREVEGLESREKGRDGDELELVELFRLDRIEVGDTGFASLL